VDHRYLFRSVEAGWCGRQHDSSVLQESELFQQAENGDLLVQESVRLADTPIPVHIIGDAAYPLKHWLMKPYPNLASVNRQQRHFNYRHSRARMVVEGAFGRLKGRRRCLMKRFDGDVHTVAIVAAACCTLHNICEIHGEEFDESWVEEVNRNQPEQPETESDCLREEVGPRQIRDSLAEWMAHGN